jgi:hypothetical protein
LKEAGEKASTAAAQAIVGATMKGGASGTLQAVVNGSIQGVAQGGKAYFEYVAASANADAAEAANQANRSRLIAKIVQDMIGDRTDLINLILKIKSGCFDDVIRLNEETHATKMTALSKSFTH